jgi:hypothetical protein
MTNNKQQTAVDKAKELVSKMEKDFQYFASRQIAIQHALIAVDEIVKEIQCNEFDFQSNVPMSVYTYWKNVKKEIENL